jgi:HPt (histidine-containing phosphotransfer) domain-containing protein
MTGKPPANVDAALDEMWNKFRPLNEERLALLDRVVAELRYGAVSDTARKSAEEAAHKIAGSAGSFGYDEATRLARRIEQMLKREGEFSSTESSELIISVYELRNLMHAHKRVAHPGE